LIHARIPGDPRVFFYLGVGAMAVAEVIEWPVALVVAAGHALAERGRSRSAQELAEGVESAA
jgi:hypothetical protein